MSFLIQKEKRIVLQLFSFSEVSNFPVQPQLLIPEIYLFISLQQVGIFQVSGFQVPEKLYFLLIATDPL